MIVKIVASVIAWAAISSLISIGLSVFGIPSSEPVITVAVWILAAMAVYQMGWRKKKDAPSASESDASVTEASANQHEVPEAFDQAVPSETSSESVTPIEIAASNDLESIVQKVESQSNLEKPDWQSAIKFGLVFAAIGVAWYLFQIFIGMLSGPGTGNVVFEGTVLIFVFCTALGFPVVWAHRKLSSNYSPTTATLTVGTAIFLLIFSTTALPILLAAPTFQNNSEKGFPVFTATPASTIVPTRQPTSVPTVRATTVPTVRPTTVPTVKLIETLPPFFHNWIQTSEGYWAANIHGALVAVSLNDDRALYEAVWGLGSEEGSAAVDQFFCDAASYHGIKCEEGLELISRALPNIPAYASHPDGMSLTATIVNQDNGFAVARFMVRP